jgi:glycerol dehydrogenase-like iron-containing ADH family enzyme
MINLNNENQQFEMLDALNIVGFFAQLDNMSKDEEQSKYIQTVIQALANEVEKLHKENDIIIEQNEEILKLLKEESK